MNTFICVILVIVGFAQAMPYGDINEYPTALNLGETECYKNLGCWKDTSNRAIAGLDWTLEGDPLAVMKCAEKAKPMGYSVFAVQYGGQCFSAANADKTYKKYGSSDACDSHGRGGAWANQVYKMGDCEVIVKNVGCWKDESDRAIDSLDYNLKGDADAVKKCAEMARERGFSTFGVQFGGQCFGSINAADTYTKYGASRACENDGRGGTWANQVYQLVKSTKVAVKHLGCWTDKPARAIDPLDMTLKGDADAVNKCALAARSKGFSVFGVQDGGQCFSAANAMQTYMNYGPSTACKDDGRGGSWANQVYMIVS